MANAQVEKLMKALDITEEEALQVIADDKRIDKGEKLFELDPELEKGAKKARQAERKPAAYKFQKRERKPNEEKREIIQWIADLLGEKEVKDVKDVKIPKVEREVTFKIGENDYSITLICHRPNKK